MLISRSSAAPYVPRHVATQCVCHGGCSSSYASDKMVLPSPCVFHYLYLLSISLSLPLIRITISISMSTSTSISVTICTSISICHYHYLYLYYYFYLYHYLRPLFGRGCVARVGICIARIDICETQDLAFGHHHSSPLTQDWTSPLGLHTATSTSTPSSIRQPHSVVHEAEIP